MNNELKKYLQDNEEWLMRQILSYAVKQDYAKYTSTLTEPWRVSISKLTEIISSAIDKYGEDIPELSPDIDFSADSMLKFGVESAKKHRTRGVTIEMYLGFFKYYRQTYNDCIEKSDFEIEKKFWYELFVKRCFDRVEISFCKEWTGKEDSELLKELQDKNRDITNEKNKYLTIFESILDPVIFVDKDGFIQNVNLQGLKVFYNKNSSGSFYYNTKKESKKFSWLEKEIDEFISNNKKEITIEKRLNISNQEKYFDIKISEMLDISSKFFGVIIIMKDVTEKVVARKQLEKAKHKAEHANKALQKSNEKLVKINSQKDKFFRILSHDLRSPFNPIMGYLDLLRNACSYSTKCNEQKELMADIDLSVQNAYKLLNNLLEWGRLQNEEINYEPKRLNLNKIINSIGEMIKPQCEQKKIDLEISIGDSLEIFADKYMIDTIIRNIVSNAIKFTEIGGKIRISAYENENLVIKISDTGVGIPKDKIKSIFEINSKYSTSGTNGEMGTGLGLILCKNFVEKNNGEISIKSELGVGTEFLLTFPINDDK